MNTERFEQVPIDKLVPYARNARTHSKEQIAQLRASLREFGFVSPAVIDADYNILVGHGRVQAAREEGYENVPCVFAENLTEAQKRAYILADNQLALNAGWDEEMLSVELSDLQDQSFDLSLLGFDAGELDKLLGTENEKDIADDDFDLTSALEKASFVEPGDIWTVGRHRLMCGDATSPEDVEKLMDGKKANLVLTDPPYGVSFKASDGLTIQNDSLKGEEFYKFLLAAFKNMADHLEKGGAAYCFHADSEGLPFRKAFIDAGFHLAGVCIWVKNSLVLGRSDYQWLISGSTSRCSTDFCKMASTRGIPTESRQPSGTTTSQSATRITRPVSRWIFWAIRFRTLLRRIPWSLIPLAAPAPRSWPANS